MNNPESSVRTPHKTTVSIINTSRLTLPKEIISVYCNTHTEHTNSLCEQRVVYIKEGYTYCYRNGLKGY